jgi:hypothetical protein
MSWDLIVLDWPADIQRFDDLPTDWQPTGDLGERSQIIAKTLALFPQAVGTETSWVTILGDGWLIEMSLGDEARLSHIGLFVRGGDSVVAALAALLDHLGFRALDLQTGDFFKPGPEAIASFRAWKDFRDQVSAAVDPEPPGQA